MALINEIKRAARISHAKLDSEIARLEEWSQAELVRVGVPEPLVSAEEDALICQAIITGAVSQLVTEAGDRDRASESFNYQLDNLRKHKWSDEP